MTDKLIKQATITGRTEDGFRLSLLFATTDPADPEVVCLGNETVEIDEDAALDAYAALGSALVGAGLIDTERAMDRD